METMEEVYKKEVESSILERERLALFRDNMEKKDNIKIFLIFLVCISLFLIAYLIYIK